MGPDKRSPTVHGILNFENFWIIDLFTYNIYRKFYVSCYIILIFEEKNPIESSCFWSESVMLSYVICYHGCYSNFNGAANNNFIKSNDNMCTQRTICVESFHSYMLKSIFCKSGNSETRWPSFSFHTLHALCNFLLELLWTKHINHTRETDKKHLLSARHGYIGIL